jgi:hypothetical protein
MVKPKILKLRQSFGKWLYFCLRDAATNEAIGGIESTIDSSCGTFSNHFFLFIRNKDLWAVTVGG